MAAAHAVYILDLKGKVIITRNYRGDLPSNIAQRFISRLLEEEELNLSPVIEDEELSFVYIRHNNLYSNLT
jgi:AP-1 complex subunit mu